MSKFVVVVESPAKAKTINRYLGSDYTVLASYGHIRDLPAKNGSVDPQEQFKMIWELDSRAGKVVSELAKALKGAETLYLATDPDREGEAISWHVQQVLEEKHVLKNTTVKRIVFNEITKSAIKDAISHPREINRELVDAYLTRRALDYLVGFTLSPVLWRKLPGARSAGRVQSVALRLIVERQQAIDVFNPQEYWSVDAKLLTPRNDGLTARLTVLDGKKLDKFDLNNQTLAEAAAEQVREAALTVAKIEKKQTKRNPAQPFITSTLQQEASRKLRFGASRTMQTAQRLYEGVEIGGEVTGLITYMRTDGVTLAQEAVDQIRGFIGDNYGKDYLPDAPRVYKSKVKNAQEAHEAIRPTSIARTPEQVRPYVDEQQYRLYELIWKRTVACQMSNAVFNQVGIDFTDEARRLTMRATGSTLVFDGFLKLYREDLDEPDPESDQDRLLPQLHENEPAKVADVMPEQHFTQPPPRFTEASLVKRLEELGIGRPSTYASMLQVLQDRQYVRLENRQFIPEDRGRIVTGFLENYFGRYVAYDFTAHMEEQLDDISAGKLDWINVIDEFWRAFKGEIDKTKDLKISDVIDMLQERLEKYLFNTPEMKGCPACKEGLLNLKLSRYGAFLGCTNYPTCAYTRPVDQAEGQEGESAVALSQPKEIGVDPETGEVITLRQGNYGVYLQWDGATPQAPVVQAAPAPEVAEADVVKAGKAPKKTKKAKAEKVAKPKRVTLPPGINADDVDVALACRLKAIPFSIGNDDEGNEITVHTGRFGPYVKHAAGMASIPKSINFLEVTLEQAKDIIAKKAARAAAADGKPRGGRGFRKKAAAK